MIKSIKVDTNFLRRLASPNQLIFYLAEQGMPVKAKTGTRLELTLDYENYIYKRSYNDNLMFYEFSWLKK